MKRECGGMGTGEEAQSVRGPYISSKGINMTVLEIIHQFVKYIMHIMYNH